MVGIFFSGAILVSGSVKTLQKTQMHWQKKIHELEAVKGIWVAWNYTRGEQLPSDLRIVTSNDDEDAYESATTCLLECQKGFKNSSHVLGGCWFLVYGTSQRLYDWKRGISCRWWPMTWKYDLVLEMLKMWDSDVEHQDPYGHGYQSIENHGIFFGESVEITWDIHESAISSAALGGGTQRISHCENPSKPWLGIFTYIYHKTQPNVGLGGGFNSFQRFFGKISP